MKYFIDDENGEVFAYEEDGSQDKFIRDGLRPMDEDEVYIHLNPPKNMFEIVAAENEWRESEMPKAQQNVTAIEYGEEGIPGTTAQWKSYWLALRKWTADNPDFPDSSKRPVAPT